jgi:predicted nucleic acid-binding Zn ribbon protein
MKFNIMRKSNTQKIGKVIDEYLRDSGLIQKLRKARVLNHWEELMGKTVANRTKSIYIKNRTLFVILSSSVLRNELSMMRQEIIDAVNKHAGEMIIDNVVLK